ncbi:hypothetical protein AB0N42_09540, partial [Streptomyces pseudogriseolus]|uniref:hypothetical protein n=1 Tax=Streptomyces pseudogriseolus TaxID=36817 RepID=UPI003487D945
PAVRALTAAGHGAFVEVSPHPVLTGPVHPPPRGADRTPLGAHQVPPRPPVPPQAARMPAAVADRAPERAGR